MLINFATNSYKSSSIPISSQRVVNCYAEQEPKDAETEVAVFGCPGLPEFATVGIGPIRGFTSMGGLLYVVSGGILYSVTSAGVSTALGGTISGTGVVGIDNNGSEIVITNGTNGYFYSVAVGFSLINDSSFNAAETVTFFDQRFILDWKDTNKFFCSETLDGLSYDPLQFASAEANPDNVKAIVLNKQILLVFGENTTEPWQDVGAANFPFERVPGVVIERGLAAPHATAKQDNSVYFFGDDRSFYRLDGVTPVRVSNHALEQEWQSYSTISDAFCFSYSWQGHKFVVLTFPTENATFELDVATSLWHERESWNEFGVSLGRWRANCHISIYGKELIGDAFSGKIGYLSEATYTEFGNTVPMICVSPPLHSPSSRKRIFIPKFEMHVEAGVGISSGQGSDPQVMVRYSKDGGFTWSDRQLWRSMGAKGNYKTRLKWLKWGNAREWVIEATITDPVRRTIIAAYADAYEGA